MTTTNENPVKVFISYAHKDENFKKELGKHLSDLARNQIIEAWDDCQVTPGLVWEEAIIKKLEEAEIVLFLLSADFVASDYINDVVIAKAIENHRKGHTVIVPVIVRSCHFQDLIISQFQILPKDALPVEKWDFVDDAYYDIVEQLKKLIYMLQNRSEVDNCLPSFLAWQKQVENNILNKDSTLFEYAKLSCDRKQISRRFDRYFDEKKEAGIKSQFYFLEGQPYGQSFSLVRRLTIELGKRESQVRELKETELVTLRSEEHLIADEIIFDLKREFHNTYGIKPPVKSLSQFLSNIDIRYPNWKRSLFISFAFEIEMTPACWEDRILKVLDWLLDSFGQVQHSERTFIFFIILNLQKKPEKLHGFLNKLFGSSGSKTPFDIFNAIKVFLQNEKRKQHATLLPPLKLVDAQDLDDWYKRFEKNEKMREAKIKKLIGKLGGGEQWNMSSVELELKQIVEEYQNEKFHM